LGMSPFFVFIFIILFGRGSVPYARAKFRPE